MKKDEKTEDVKGKKDDIFETEIDFKEIATELANELDKKNAASERIDKTEKLVVKRT